MCRAFFIPTTIDKDLNIWTIDLGAFRGGVAMKKRYRGIGAGIALLCLSGIFVALFILVLIVTDKNKEDVSGLGGLAFFVAIPGIASIAFGIACISKGLISKKVDEQGRKGTCVVERFDCYPGRFVPSIWMTVSFKGEDGEMHENSTRVNNEFINAVSKGTILECKILRNKCYVDVDCLKISKYIDK